MWVISFGCTEERDKVLMFKSQEMNRRDTSYVHRSMSTTGGRKSIGFIFDHKNYFESLHQSLYFVNIYYYYKFDLMR